MSSAPGPRPHSGAHPAPGLSPTGQGPRRRHEKRWWAPLAAASFLVGTAVGAATVPPLGGLAAWALMTYACRWLRRPR